MNHFSIRLWCAMKSGFYMTTRDDQLSGWTKKKLQSTSQSQTCTIKRSWLLFGGLLPVWSIIAFWILAKPLYLRIMFCRLMRCTENCNACNQHWSTDRSPFFSMITPDHTPPTNISKVEWIGLWSFCLIRHIHLTSLTNQLPLLQASWQLFVGKMLPQPAGGRKCFLRVCWILKHGFLCYRNKQAFLVGKNVLIVMVPILINKDVFEPCYNDLKFKVQNCNYFCTRLITQLEALKKTL